MGLIGPMGMVDPVSLLGSVGLAGPVGLMGRVGQDFKCAQFTWSSYFEVISLQICLSNDSKPNLSPFQIHSRYPSNYSLKHIDTVSQIIFCSPFKSFILILH